MLQHYLLAGIKGQIYPGWFWVVLSIDVKYLVGNRGQGDIPWTLDFTQWCMIRREQGERATNIIRGNSAEESITDVSCDQTCNQAFCGQSMRPAKGTKDQKNLPSSNVDSWSSRSLACKQESPRGPNRLGTLRKAARKWVSSSQSVE